MRTTTFFFLFFLSLPLVEDPPPLRRFRRAPAGPEASLPPVAPPAPVSKSQLQEI